MTVDASSAALKHRTTRHRQHPDSGSENDVNAVTAAAEAEDENAATIAVHDDKGTTTFLLKNIAIAVLFLLLSSRIITNSWTWGYSWSPYAHLPRALVTPDRTFSAKQLQKHDGSDPNLAIYLAINGIVYDVTPGRDYYGPGGSYHIFAGRDASRSFVTGCFEEPYLTHDLRGLTPGQIKEVENWQTFYDDHEKYFRVGKVVHPPIDPASPVPEDCNKPKGAKP